MSLSPGLRSAFVAAGLFATALGILTCRAGGLLGPTAREPRPSSADTPPLQPPTEPTMSEGHRRRPTLGTGDKAQVEHDEDLLLGDQRVRWRVWQAFWDKSRPLVTSEPDVDRRIVEGLVLHLMPRPTESRPIPAGPQDPGAVRIKARQAELAYAQGRKPDADLEGDVVMTRVLADGDLVLKSQALTCIGATRAVTSDAEVRIVTAGSELTGRGLEANLNTVSARIGSNVVGTFSGLDSPFTVTCDGAATIVHLDPAGTLADARTGRWRAVFQDNVRVVRVGSVMTCERLEVELTVLSENVAQAAGTDGRPRLEKLVADGRVVIESTQDGEAFSASSERMTQWREAPDTDVLHFEGNPRFSFLGVLRTRSRQKANPNITDEMMEISCSGSAQMTAQPMLGARDGKRRIKIVLRDDVRAAQTNVATGELISELTAPLVTVYGTQTKDATITQGTRRDPSDRLDLDTLAAEGGTHIKHQAFKARSEVATWTVDRTLHNHEFLLSGRPVVTVDNIRSVNPFGGKVGAVEDTGTVQITSLQDVDIQVYDRRINTSLSNPDAPTNLPWLKARAKGGVVVEQQVGETVPYRLAAEGIDALFGHDRQLERMTAYGDAKLTGRGEGDKGAVKEGFATGQRILVTRERSLDPMDPWQPSAIILGTETEPALAILREEGTPDRTARRHEIRARQLQYTGNGTIIVAEREVDALLDLPYDEGATSEGGPGKPLRTIQILASKLRAEFERRAVGPGPGGERSVLRTVVASNGVRLIARQGEVRGDEVEYDAEEGIAIARGRPARVIFAEHPELGPKVTSFLNSKLITAYLDTSTEGAGRLRRITCDGGRIVRYMWPDAEPGTPLKRPERIRIDSNGPIDMTPEGGTIKGGVIAVWEQPSRGARWDEDARIQCDEMELGFDSSGLESSKDKLTGEQIRDRVQTVVARSNGKEPVRLRTPKMSATADVIRGNGTTTELKLDSSATRRVVVKEMEPVKRRFRCESAIWNYRTYEIVSTYRFEALTD